MKCQVCNNERAHRRRQRTSYVDDEMNFATLCDKCQDEADEYWNGQWDEYYSSVMGIIPNRLSNPLKSKVYNNP